MSTGKTTALTLWTFVGRSQRSGGRINENKRTAREIIEQDFLPSALAIGVDYGTFWRLNPRLLKSFIDADRLKKRQFEMEMYINGRYMFDAVSISLANAFRNKGTMPINWMDEPYRMLPLTEEEERSRAEEVRLKVIAFFNSMIPKTKGGEENG